MNLKFPKQEDEGFVNRLKKILQDIKLPSFLESNLLEKMKNFADKLRENMTIKYAAAGVIAIIVVFIGISAIFSEDEPVENPHRVKFKVKEGMDAAEIARRLEKEGLIDSGFKFRMLAKWGGYEDKLKVGSYNLNTAMTYDEIFQKLLAGEPEVIQFTIPEGFGVRDIAKRLEETGLADREEFLKKAEKFVPYDYVEKRSNVFYYCEGFLFPDTYEVDNDVEVDDILKLMAENFDYRLNKKMRERAKEEGLSIYDLITLASIVEKEVRYPEDRPIVAQVFFKRLKLDMPLQTDASLQYLMDTPKEDVSIADTKIDSPYNTYQHKGLTPGPIANPGIESINAVLYPADTNYLYFVADRSGHNHYSDNYEEHLKLVNQYR